MLLAAAAVLAARVTPDVSFRGGPFSAVVVAALVAAATLVAHRVLRWIPRSDNVLVLAALTLMVTVFSVALTWVGERLLERRARGRTETQSSGS